MAVPTDTYPVSGHEQSDTQVSDTVAALPTEAMAANLRTSFDPLEHTGERDDADLHPPEANPTTEPATTADHHPELAHPPEQASPPEEPLRPDTTRNLGAAAVHRAPVEQAAAEHTLPPQVVAVDLPNRAVTTSPPAETSERLQPEEEDHQDTVTALSAVAIAGTSRPPEAASESDHSLVADGDDEVRAEEHDSPILDPGEAGGDGHDGVDGGQRSMDGGGEERPERRGENSPEDIRRIHASRYEEFTPIVERLEAEIAALPHPRDHGDFIGEGGDAADYPGDRAYRIGGPEAPEDKRFVIRIPPEGEDAVEEQLAEIRYKALLMGRELDVANRAGAEQVVAHGKYTITGYEGKHLSELSEEDRTEILTSSEAVLRNVRDNLIALDEHGLVPDLEDPQPDVVWNSEKQRLVFIDYVEKVPAGSDPDRSPESDVGIALWNFRLVAGQLASKFPDETQRDLIINQAAELIQERLPMSVEGILNKLLGPDDAPDSPQNSADWPGMITVEAIHSADSAGTEASNEHGSSEFRKVPIPVTELSEGVDLGGGRGLYMSANADPERAFVTYDHDRFGERWPTRWGYSSTPMAVSELDVNPRAIRKLMESAGVDHLEIGFHQHADHRQSVIWAATEVTCITTPDGKVLAKISLNRDELAIRVADKMQDQRHVSKRDISSDERRQQYWAESINNMISVPYARLSTRDRNPTDPSVGRVLEDSDVLSGLGRRLLVYAAYDTNNHIRGRVFNVKRNDP